MNLKEYSKNVMKPLIVKAILSTTSKLGIGRNGDLLVSIKQDLERFKELTLGQIVVMGRKTWDSLPVKPLPRRINIVLTTGKNRREGDVYFTDYKHFEKTINKIGIEKTIYIIGGAETLEYFIKHADAKWRPSELLLTHIKTTLEPDTFLKSVPEEYKLASFSEEKKDLVTNTSYTYLVYKRHSHYKTDEKEYLNLMRRIQNRGVEKVDRTGTGTLSVFGEQMRFNIRDSFPLLTTKFVTFKGVFEELTWFLRGETDSKILERRGVNIWKGNTSRQFLDSRGLDYPEGILGPGYGWSIRHFGEPYQTIGPNRKNKRGKDQLEYILKLLKTDPDSRRIYMSYWNPMELDNIALVPCHVSFQLYTRYDKELGKRLLSGHLYQRSMDVFLGAPWNIASYALLIYILAKKCDMIPDELVISTGDTHIYNNHKTQVEEQLGRSPLPFPKVQLSNDIIKKDWKDITFSDVRLVGYLYNPSIKAKMAV